MSTRERSIIGLATLAMTVLATGCLDRELKPLNPCLVSGVSRKVQVKNVDKVDLLFMVDNSNSMAGEQTSLKAQFPKVIEVLTTGMRSPMDTNPFPPAKDLHVGVVSSDMGIPGVNYGNCHADGGDDGKLQHTPRGAGCDASYPLFLSYHGDAKTGMLTDPVKFANDVGCIATLGTGGCGFEQQLESPFKALWPMTYMDINGNIVPNKYTFLSISMDGTHGKGDVPEAQGGNLGFLRNDPARGLSLIAIVLVTDEEDCSVRTAEHLWPENILPAGSPYLKEDINLRCFKHKEFLYDIKNRYYNGFRALRTGNEELVVFAAITGVPPDTVDAAALANVDFDNDDSRNRFYDQILADSRMIEQEDPASMPGTGMGNLKPSCVRAVPGETTLSTAYPPRRIVELAKMFGRNGVVQSICQDDFGPAMEAIINVIAKQLGEVCLPRPLVRQRSGQVPCNVVWELPRNAIPGSGTPVECSQATFLLPVDTGRATMNAAGGNNCKVQQLPVRDADTAAKTPPPGEGWYYDNYTAELVKTCSKTQQQRVAFTANAKPPTGVTVKLECLNETQKLPDTRTNLALTQQPEIGTACGKDMTGDMPGPSGDEACKVTLSNGQFDQQYAMFCHPNLNVCVRQCASDTDCPPAWVCDKRADTLKIEGLKGPYCVNPTCGADTGS